MLTGPGIREVLTGGKKLRAEFDVTIYETAVPSRHMWNPESGDCRALRTYKIIRTWP